ncbi:hypothetical protein [Halovivax cerinus]|uniref:CARDB domain-containing protein n=1 Tax=Halovivax cerinus TaxID=1487865 RepID=A0ABD5NTJ3_9EURY|nr:hypothetical protein [Halovivax cerinus]
MRRRAYLSCIGAAGVGGVGAVGPDRSESAPSGSIERLGSPDPLTVTPNSAVLFEVAVPDGVDPTAVDWDLDELSGGPLLDLSFVTGTAVRSARFESRGTYTLRASHDGTTVEWEVTVADDGRDPPRIDTLSTTPCPDETVGVSDSVAVVADAIDDEADLERLVWVEGRNYTVVAIHEIEGGSDSSTLSLEETPHWIEYGYPTVAYPVCADGRLGAGATSDGPAVRQPFALDVVETNAPVTAGDRFEATVSVANVGDMMMVGPNTQAVRLVVGDEVVDSRSVTLDWTESTTIALGYETYPVEQDVTFPVRVECSDDAVTREIDVTADDSSGGSERGSLSVSIAGTNAPVTGGQWLSTTATVSATGSGSASGPVELVVGGEVVGSTAVDVPDGGRSTVTLGYSTYPVRQDVTVTLVVRTPDDSASTSVRVYGTG